MLIWLLHRCFQDYRHRARRQLAECGPFGADEQLLVTLVGASAREDWARVLSDGFVIKNDASACWTSASSYQIDRYLE